ncbi:MerR family transcriptional regulator [Streptomyces sp. NPDC020917]|uniref:MerR family transcriptional regulator n=1 Tax=Streptomyces sp. NPDC020917 TaxID=3365102 RepID=UPI00379FDC72
MRIGEFAERAGVSPRALRYYEKQGLLAARREANGYREYQESDLRLVVEIRTLLAAGFTLADTRPFVDCLRAGHDSGAACPESVTVARRRLAAIDAEIRTLLERRAEISGQLARTCGGCTPHAADRPEPGPAPRPLPRAVLLPAPIPAAPGRAEGGARR